MQVESELSPNVVAASAAVRPNNGTTMGVLGPPKPPAPLDVEPRWQQKRHTTWHGKQELRAHNRAFDASQLSKKRAQAQRGPPTPPRVDDKAAVRKARAAAHQRVLEYKKLSLIHI